MVYQKQFLIFYRDCIAQGHDFKNGFASQFDLLLGEDTHDLFEKEESVKNGLQVGASGIRFQSRDQMLGSPENVRTFRCLKKSSNRLRHY